MSWEDQMRPARFRTADFYVEVSEEDLGRRKIVHEYPGRDKPLVEDQGRKARDFSIEAFVLGDDYMDARDKLIRACEEDGPGTLVHPYYGSLTVSCTGCRVRQGTAQGGIARFILTFVEAGDDSLFEARVIDHSAETEETADDSTEDFESAFADEYDSEGPEILRTSALEDLAAAMEMLRTRIAAARGIISGWVGRILNLIADAATLLVDIINLPGDIAETVAGAIGGISGLVDYLEDPVEAVLIGIDMTRFGEEESDNPSLYGGMLTSIPETTATRLKQAANRKAVVDLVRNLALVEACRAAVRIDYDSYEDAALVREKIADAIDAQLTRLGDAGDDDSYQALARLRPQVILALEAKGATLAHVTTYTPPSGYIPAIVLAHRLYQDIERESEILARNDRIIRHPGFLPGGVALEVLAE